MESDMSKHDWEKRDFDGRKRCKRCGLVTWSLKFADIADECSGKFLANAVLDLAVRTGPYTQAELDRAAAACKPAGTDWQRWRLDYAAPRNYVEVIDCFGKQHAPVSAFTINNWDTIVWYRVRADLGVIGVDAAAGPDSTVLPLDVIDRAKKLMDETCDVKPFAYVIHADQWTPEQLAGIKQAKSVADAVDKVCGLPPFGKIEKRIDARSEALRQLVESISRPSVFARQFITLDEAKALFPAAPRKRISDGAQKEMVGHGASRQNEAAELLHWLATRGCVVMTDAERDALTANRTERFGLHDYGNYVLDTVTGKRYVREELYTRIRKLADDVARDASRPGLSRELRERAERAAGRVTAVNFTRAAPDEAIVTHLCEIVERLAGSDVAQLDQENARLRRELAEANRSRDGWQGQARTLMSLTAGLRKRLGEREDNVVYVVPFPDVEPYAGDWIPPSHKPRMLP